jgi:hypothetical protein
VGDELDREDAQERDDDTGDDPHQDAHELSPSSEIRFAM